MASPFFASRLTCTFARKEPNGTSPAIRLKNHTQLPQPEGWTVARFWREVFGAALGVSVLAVFVFLFITAMEAFRDWLISGLENIR